MRALKFITTFCSLLLLIVLGSKSIPTGDTSLPPLGHFLSPFTGFWQNGNQLHPENINISSLDAEGQVFLDDRGVPHIFANSYEDAIRIQGYLHAKNRLFQMDITSRFTAGRLSEIFGNRMLSVDKIMRRRGLPFAAENALAGYEKHENSLGILNAYTDGVNAYIASLRSNDYPIEYKLLNAKIEPWTNLKTALINKSMTFDLCFRNEDDLATKALEIVGEEMYQFLYPFRNKKEEPIIPKGTQWTNKSDIGLEINYSPQFPSKHFLKEQLLMPDEALGSNNWAVSGSKTKSGAPILCNDPHLRLRLPSVWYELQIHCPKTNVYGVSLPGAPGVIIGFNQQIAWGVTNVGMDVLDWYQIKWKDKDEGIYILDGKEIQAERRIESIQIKGQEKVIDEVWYTKWGPLPYQDDTEHYLHDHALRWLGHDMQTVDELGCFIGLNHASSLQEYLQSTKKFRSPAQNIICATKEDHIALRVSGAIPKRSLSQAQFLQDGSSSSNGWNDFVDTDENPKVINPERGFVASANQISTDSSYPYPYYGYFAEYRGRLLNEKLAKMSDITPKDLMDLQNNDESLLANEGLNMLLKAIAVVPDISPKHQEILQKLRSWDRTFKANELGPALFFDWFTSFYQMTWDEFNQDNSKIKIPEYWRTIEIANDHPNHAYFNIKATDKIETASDIARLSLMRVYHKMDSLLSEDKNYNWGKYNNNRITHLLNIPAFSTDVNLVDGFKYALNATNATHGPSWRMVVEMSDPIQAWGIYPGGQSGHPGHQHYDDMIENWVNGEYYKLDFIGSLDDVDLTSGQLIKCQTQ